MTSPVVVEGVCLLVVDRVPELHQVQLVLLHLDEALAILLHPGLDAGHLGVDVPLGLLHHEGLAKLFPDLLDSAGDNVVCYNLREYPGVELSVSVINSIT